VKAFIQDAAELLHGLYVHAKPIVQAHSQYIFIQHIFCACPDIPTFELCARVLSNAIFGIDIFC